MHGASILHSVCLCGLIYGLWAAILYLALLIFVCKVYGGLEQLM